MVVTPDDDTLIVAETFARRFTAFDIAADGSLTNRRVWADVTGDGICIDAEGPCGAATSGRTTKASVLASARVVRLDLIELDRPCYVCHFGGDDGRTLFMVVAKWFGPDRIDELLQEKTGQIRRLVSTCRTPAGRNVSSGPESIPAANWRSMTRPPEIDSARKAPDLSDLARARRVAPAAGRIRRPHEGVLGTFHSEGAGLPRPLRSLCCLCCYRPFAVLVTRNS
jgi:hypothetical protein